MRTNEFLEALKGGTLPACLLFTGEEEYLKDMSLRALREVLLPQGLEEMNETRLDATAGETAILDAAQQLPFLAEKRLIVVRDHPFAFPAPRMGEPSLDALCRLAASPPPGLCLLFTGPGKADMRKKLPAAIRKAGGLVEFPPLEAPDAARWARREAARMGKGMDAATAERLVFFKGASLWDLRSEIEKAAAFVGERDAITVRDLEAVVTPTLEANVFAMMDALLDGESGLALKRLHALLLEGESPLAILPLLGRNVRQICQAKLLTKGGAGRQQMEKEMGVPAFVVRRALDRAASFEERWLLGTLRMLDECDYEIKSGQIGERQALDRAVLRLMRGAASEKGRRG